MVPLPLAAQGAQGGSPMASPPVPVAAAQHSLPVALLLEEPMWARLVLGLAAHRELRQVVAGVRGARRSLRPYWAGEPGGLAP